MYPENDIYTSAYSIDSRSWRSAFVVPSRSQFFDLTGSAEANGKIAFPFKQLHRWSLLDEEVEGDVSQVQITIPSGRRIILDHPRLVGTATWSPDETRVLTAAQDGFARIWDGRSGRLLAEVSFAERWEDGRRVPVDMASWSPDGNWILLFSEGSRLQIEPASLVQLLQLARTRLAATPSLERQE
jgi:WD40 repeat protein